MAKLSVIITAYNNDELTFVHARESLAADTRPDEVIVVNDGGDESLEQRLEELPDKKGLIYARIEQDIPWNYHGACNLGVWLSTGEYLAFEDNDNIPTRDFYTQAISILDSDPEIGRVVAKKRWQVEDISGPMEEWHVFNKIGPNQGTATMRRNIYLFLKGQDERFVGRYGWMYYDWKNRLLNRAKTTFGEAGQYYHYTGGQVDLNRKMEKENYWLYQNNARHGVVQSPEGILNFTYTYRAW